MRADLDNSQSTIEKIKISVQEFFHERFLFIKIIEKHPLIFSATYTYAILMIMWFGRLVRWEGADDFTISQLLMGSSGRMTPYVLVCSYFFCELVIWLQGMIPIVNWFTVLELLAVWLSFVIMDWFLFKHSEGTKMLYAIMFPIITEPLYLLTLNYTRCAFILPFAGMVLIYDASIGKLYYTSSDCSHGDSHQRRGRMNTTWRICKIAIGLVLFIWGSFFRYSCFYAGIAYVGIFVFGYIIGCIRHKKIVVELPHIISFIICMLFVLGISAVIYGRHINTYSQSKEITTYQELNKKRSDVIDYLPPEYSQTLSNEALYVSYNDWYMMRRYIINDGVFSIDYFDKVLNNIQDAQKKNNSISNLRLEGNSQKARSLNSYNFRQVFNYRSGRGAGIRTQFCVCVAICVASVLFTKGNVRICVILDIIGTLAFVGYFLLGDRFPPWVSDSIYLLSSYVALVYQSSMSNMFREKNTNIIYKCLWVTVILFCVFNNISVCKSLVSVNYSNMNLKAAMEYAENSEEVFLLDTISNAPYPYIDCYGATAYFEKGQWANIIRVGNWDCGNPERNQQMASLGIDSVLLSMAEGKSLLISMNNSSSFEMYRLFYKEHYDIDVEFSCLRSFGEYGIFKAVKTNTEHIP